MRYGRGEALGADRELADVLREVNELRRSRSLPEYEPTTTNFRVTPSPPSDRRLMFLVRRCLSRRRALLN